MKKITIGLFSALLSFSAWFTSAAELRDDHPEFHIVQPGDTLWDISEMFLKSPWLWPEIWHVNNQVENPHLIFPGDIIALVYIDGQPRITKNMMPNGTIKLRPKARELSADSAISTIPLDAISPFLTSAQVVSKEELDNAAYIVGSDSGRVLAAENNKVYVRGVKNEADVKFTFFREGNPYIDPNTQELLGIEAIHVAEGLKEQHGDPTVMRLKKSVTEVRKGDLAIPTNEEQLRPLYFPHAPDNFEDGQIISVYGGVEQIGQYHIVVINRGEREGMEIGHVLSIYQRGITMEDEIAEERNDNSETGDVLSEVVTLPDEYAGRLMIFRTFEKVSLGLVLKAERAIHKFDKVKTPL
ncbi:LysM peptidoglycan-binding domain-containing protein [Aliikangiella sp. G2MR2-5]|uniref:LysM peptidoglycan-binding domain-containing protein n=1 Tax=Aliikangiella sp. G2MR2-5 TaxID=2788943 RepID=UPI0018A88DE0|nr:LysM domain-containing protein [Aliikangiella sp. G2MR2-5]